VERSFAGADADRGGEERSAFYFTLRVTRVRVVDLRKLGEVKIKIKASRNYLSRVCVRKATRPDEAL